jgi:F-type H+-transporting ATPase subunit d
MARAPPAARGDLGSLRGRYETLKAAMNAYPEKPEPIPWDYYKNTISDSKLVDSFKKQFEAIAVPYPEDTRTPYLNEQEKEANKLAQEAIAKSKVQVSKLEVELDKIKKQKPYEDMTIDEFLDDHPDLKKEIDEEIKRGEWY